MVKKFISFILFLLVLVSALSSAFASNFSLNFTPTCEALYLVNLDTNTTAFNKNGDKKMYPASLTKIMTYIIVIENVDDIDNTIITIKDDLIKSLLGTGSSISGIKANEQLSIRQLLHCLMIKSGNDAAIVLADISKFVNLMNDKAKSLGCNNTHFMNPHGLHDENHYTTASDMALITKHAMTLPYFIEITSMSTSYIMGENKYPLVTTNSMIDLSRGGKYYYAPAKGIKTGHTDEAGQCLVSSAVNNGYTYLCVALGAPTKDANGNKIQDNYAMLDSKELYKWAFSTLQIKPILNRKNMVGEVNVKLASNRDTLMLVPSDDFSALLPKEVSSSSVDIQVEKPEFVKAPIKAGQKIGTATLKYANVELAKVDLVASEDIERNWILFSIDFIGNIISSIWFKISLFLAISLIILYIILIKVKYTYVTNKLFVYYNAYKI